MDRYLDLKYNKIVHAFELKDFDSASEILLHNSNLLLDVDDSIRFMATLAEVGHWVWISEGQIGFCSAKSFHDGFKKEENDTV